MAVYDPRGGGSVHIDVLLTNISVGFPNNDFVGEALFPSVPVAKQSDLYRIYGHEGWGLEPGADYRAPGGEANEIPGLQVSTNPYFAKEHALQIAVTDEERENADAPLSPERDGTELVTSKVMLGREIAMQQLVTTAANYATGNSTVYTDPSTAQWNDYVNSDPIGDVKKARRAVNAQLFMDPTTFIFPYQVMSALEDHPDFIERIKYSQIGVTTPELIARMFGISNIIVPAAGFNSARMGQSLALQYLWGKDVVLAMVPPRAGLKIPAFGYEFTWTFGGTPQIVDRWREEKRASDIIRVRRRYDLRFMAVDNSGKSIAGYLLKQVLASTWT